MGNYDECQKLTLININVIILCNTIIYNNSIKSKINFYLQIKICFHIQDVNPGHLNDMPQSAKYPSDPFLKEGHKVLDSPAVRRHLNHIFR